jgi:hypothetical protein
LIALSLGCSRASRVPADWAGDYTYEADFGRNAGGTGMVVTYQLHLQGTACTLSADGYQTDEQLLCTVHAEGSTLDVRFRSYADGGQKNIYGIAPYRPGESLFTLMHTPRGRLITGWGPYLSNDTSHTSAVRFRRDTAPAPSAP